MCEKCNGTGLISAKELCEACEGTGSVEVVKETSHEEIKVEVETSKESEE